MLGGMLGGRYFFVDARIKWRKVCGKTKKN